MEVANFRCINCSHSFVNDTLLQQHKSCTFFSRSPPTGFKELNIFELHRPNIQFILLGDMNAISLNILSNVPLVKELHSNSKIVKVTMRQ